MICKKLGLVFAVLFTTPLLQAEPPAPFPNWTKVEPFAIHTTLHTDAKDNNNSKYPQWSFVVGIQAVLNKEPVWRIEMVPIGLGDKHHLFVSRETGLPLKFVRPGQKAVKAPIGFPVIGPTKDIPDVEFPINAAECPLIPDPPDRIPFELFPLAISAPRMLPGTMHTFETTVEDFDQGKIYTATLRKAEQELIRVRQYWVAGERWWRRFERYRNGELQLAAIRVEQKQSPPLPKYVPTLEDRQAKLLQSDPRMMKLVSVKYTNVPLQSLLDQLQRDTGATLVMSPELASQHPLIIYADAPRHPAWQVALQASKTTVDDGVWEKSDTGFVLTGSRPKQSVPPPKAVIEAQPIDSTAPKSNRWYLFFGILGAIALGLGIIAWRMRASRLRANAIPPTGGVS